MNTRENRQELRPERKHIALLPQSLDNDYSGSRVALGFFILLTAVTLVRSLIHIFAPDGGAQSIATIPLNAFTENGADAMVHIFALWGLSQLVIGIIYLIALLRYRSLIPLLYLLAIIEYVVRFALTFAKPFNVERTAPGAVGNYILVPLLALMFALSLAGRRKDQTVRRGRSHGTS